MGRFAIGLMGTSLLGSGAVIAIAARAGAAAEAALSDPPGPGTASVRHRSAKRDTHWLQTMTGWPYHLPAGIERLDDIPYTPGYTLDIYRPKTPADRSAARRCSTSTGGVGATVTSAAPGCL